MKKLLVLLLLSPLAFAEEETKQNICYAKAYKIIESGLAPCKENDILIIKKFWMNWAKENWWCVYVSGERMMVIPAS